MADQDGAGEIARLQSHRCSRSLLALALWADDLPVELWKRLLAGFGEEADGELPIDRDNRSGRACVRSRHRHLVDCIARAAGAEEVRRLGAATLATVRDQWRSLDPRELTPLLRFAARTGVFPRSFRWHVCRALIVLLDRGRFADIEHNLDQVRVPRGLEEGHGDALGLLTGSNREVGDVHPGAHSRIH